MNLSLSELLRQFSLGKLFSLRLGPRRKDYVGIDIGSESAKAVELSWAKGRPMLATYGELKSTKYFQNAPGFTASGFLGYDDENIVRLLSDLFKEVNIKTKQAVFSIPSSASFITTVTLPLIKPEEIEAAIPFEAKKYIPIPLNEIALDWQIIESDPAAGRVTILLAAVPQEVITKFRRIAEALSLDLVAVEIESFSLIRSLLGQDRGVAAILNIGAFVSTLTVASRGIVRLNHNFARGSHELTLVLAQSLGVSEDRAEELKRTVGLSDRPEERGTMETIAPFIDGLLSEAERTMVSYNRANDAKIERIVLAGGSAAMNGLSNYVSQRFGLATSVGNPFTAISHPAFLDQMLREVAPNFAVATGLALRQLTGE
jgi:type IV pilus assembly protein PilM